MNESNDEVIERMEKWLAQHLARCPFCKALPKESPHWPKHYGCPTEACTAYAANLPAEEWNQRVSNLTLTIEDWLKDHRQTIACTDCGAEMPNDAYARRYGRCARHVDEERAGNISEDEDRSVEPFPHVSERERGMSHPAFGDIRLPLNDRLSPPQSREDKLRAALESYVALHGMSVLAKEALEAE